MKTVGGVDNFVDFDIIRTEEPVGGALSSPGRTWKIPGRLNNTCIGFTNAPTLGRRYNCAGS